MPATQEDARIRLRAELHKALSSVERIETLAHEAGDGELEFFGRVVSQVFAQSLVQKIHEKNEAGR